MKKKKFLMCTLFLSLALLSGCDKNKINLDENTKISFKSAASYDYLSTLNNKSVTINGYMATSSPVDGSFIFLMNLPYQSCPFCKPNTSQLSNSIEVFPKKNEKFSYTNSAIQIVGTLIVAEDVNKPFKDVYGYEFNFKIVDAEYKILKDSDLSENLALWQKVANSGLIDSFYKMYDYVNFCCDWPNYFVNSYTNSKGENVTGYYLYASDALHYLQTEGSQWNYGYKKGYFDSIISKINGISDTEFTSLINNVNKAKELAEYAVSELTSGNYSYSLQYVEKFGTEDYVYKLNDETLMNRWENLYYEFTDWLGNFEV